MTPSMLQLISPRLHRSIDLLTFPALLLAAHLVGKRDGRAGAIVLATAFVEGVASATTDYPPPIWRGRISFRTHNLWAASHGLLLAAAAAGAPGLSRFGRRAIATLAVMPIAMAVLSDTRSTPPRRLKRYSRG